MTDQVTEEGVRPLVATLSEIPEDLSNVTMRFGVDLLKGFQAFDESSITPTELAYATQNFIEVANAIAVREGVPGSLIGYVIQETAVQELQLAMVADVEAQMNAPLAGPNPPAPPPELIEVGGYSPEELLDIEEGVDSDGNTIVLDDLNTGEPTSEATAKIDRYIEDLNEAREALDTMTEILGEVADDGEEG